MFVFFATAMFAGQIIDVQTGFGFAHVMDQIFGGQVALSGKYLNVAMLLMFFLTDSHHLMFRILYETFVSIPPGAPIFTEEMAGVFLEIFKN